MREEKIDGQKDRKRETEKRLDKGTEGRKDFKMGLRF